MKSSRRYLLLLIAASGTFCTSVAQAEGWVTLDASRCKPVDVAATLPDAWSKYRGSTRICPLTRHQSDVAQVSLLSVFVDDYYLGLPKDAPWESFPQPMLVDPSGQCLARLSHLYPSEPPSQLVVRAGGWKQGVPTLLRFDVLNPAVSGNYSLPGLKWDMQTKRYRPIPTTTITTPTEPPCP